MTDEPEEWLPTIEAESWVCDLCAAEGLPIDTYDAYSIPEFGEPVLCAKTWTEKSFRDLIAAMPPAHPEYSYLDEGGYEFDDLSRPAGGMTVAAYQRAYAEMYLMMHREYLPPVARKPRQSRRRKAW